VLLSTGAEGLEAHNHGAVSRSISRSKTRRPCPAKNTGRRVCVHARLRRARARFLALGREGGPPQGAHGFSAPSCAGTCLAYCGGAPVSAKGQERQARRSARPGSFDRSHRLGASLFGGVGTPLGSLIGALTPGGLQNGLTLMNVPSFWRYVASGVVVIVAVYADRFARPRR
jgi:hypothetical protein